MIGSARLVARLAVALGLAASAAMAQEAFPDAQVKRGADLYESNCAACHGLRMRGADWAPDLRTFPKTQRARFVDVVVHGKAAMPPWGDVLKADEIESLWAYLVAGEK
jgi:mono/diheme cytochrome c family protein